MELCLHTDSVPGLTLEGALDLAVEIGAGAVELAAGGQSSAPHLSLAELLAGPRRRDELRELLAARGLRIGALNCSAWLLHPRRGEEQLEIVRGTIRLAGELGVAKIVTMSGCPGDSPSARMLDWITYPWPAEAVAVLEEQWELALSTWRQLAGEAAAHGVARIALELHPLQLVYNVPTLLRLRAEIGPILGANVDPSHLFWQQIDPVRAAEALGPAVHHVHLKDVEMRAEELALAGVLDSRPFADPERRAWIFRTVGRGHGRSFWASFLEALRRAGYDDVLSIENEDPLQPAEEGVRDAAAFISGVLAQGLKEAPA